MRAIFKIDLYWDLGGKKREEKGGLQALEDESNHAYRSSAHVDFRELGDILVVSCEGYKCISDNCLKAPKVGVRAWSNSLFEQV